MGIIGTIKSFFMVVLGVLGIIETVKEEAKEVRQKNIGKNEVAVETIQVLEEERKDNAELRENIDKRTDADLRANAGKWVRD